MLTGLDVDLVIRNYFMFIFILFYIYHMYLHDSNALLLMFDLYFIYLDYHEMIQLQF